ncbi:flippase-like domain-containing protein [Labilibaculum sp. DW002]|uniref:Flippase-like domain-containing protein n=1 Tax=Paralabilibaculum antarcticum TaxID=2912572 RepID=A0ABT5VUL4_9BACT|nr:lysylphosphatidylglycerol synthase transmembrane domain-containing protein [Labilibaculum sp. DW002]MDE5418497.1 flippase-like domain-containing protein [Labilibaculum sp. DW002]
METKQADSQKKLLDGVRPSRIVYPIIIGFAAVVYLLIKEVDGNTLSLIDFSWYSLFWICIALVMMLIRDLGYMARLRILTDQTFSWRQAFRIIMLWEFTSAITPSAIGGTSVAILYLNKEGLKVGRSSAVVMSTSFLDELYFILMFPLLILFLDIHQLFMITSPEHSLWLDSLLYFALGGYLVKMVYFIVLTYGLFWNPRGLKWLLLWIFKLPVLRKWKHGANKAGSDIIESSKELRRKPFLFWMKAFMATFWSWTARYWVVNVILLAFMFQGYSITEHIMIFARQLVMWIMMLVSPTPGGSGFSEWVFTKYLGEFLPSAGVAASMALLWRLISYYPYLFIGVYILPRWIKKHFRN